MDDCKAFAFQISTMRVENFQSQDFRSIKALLEGAYDFVAAVKAFQPSYLRLLTT